MKKIMCVALMALLCASTAYADGITVTVDGENVVFDPQPVIDNDRTLVPMRAIFEAIGASIGWVADYAFYDVDI